LENKMESIELELRKLNRIIDIDEDIKEILSNVFEESNYIRWDIKKELVSDSDIYELEKKFMEDMKSKFDLLSNNILEEPNSHKKAMNVIENLTELLNQSIESDSIKYGVLQQVFNSEFNGQVSNLKDDSSKSFLMLEEV